ncbi:MAG: ketol-acid reductoisomerase [Planctomycetota bacterium]|nr:ketol-acid reductoisomerase [Planctomycetota bacterium]MDA1105479.1 ketol-acid reductoisomerase [Planctomycetota bacterium]
MPGSTQTGETTGDLYRRDRNSPPERPSPLACVIGFGNQGSAHAGNLLESGWGVTVTGRPNSAALALAAKSGFRVVDLAEALTRPDLVILAVPDQVHAAVWARVSPLLPPSTVVGFLHGASVHFGIVRRPDDRAFVLVAPKGPGTTLRERFLAGLGIPAMVAVEAPEGDRARAHALAMAWADGIGCTRAGVIQTTFRDEAVADIFGEQAILCGGLVALMRTSFDTLVAAGVDPRVAYIECIQELKQIGDLVYTKGIAGMRRAISDTAEAGIDHAASTLPLDELRTGMATLLAEVESGRFFGRFLDDAAAGGAELRAARAEQAASDMERVGDEVRSMYLPRAMPLQEPIHQ